MNKKMFVALMFAAGVGGLALVCSSVHAGGFNSPSKPGAKAQFIDSIFDRRLGNRVSKEKWNALKAQLKMNREPIFEDDLVPTYEKESQIIAARKMKNGTTHQYWAKTWGIGEDKGIQINQIVLSRKKVILSTEFLSLDSGGELYDYTKLKKGWRFDCVASVAGYHPHIARKLNIAYYKAASLTHLLLKALKI